MIYTSSYNNCNTDKYNIYSISGDRGKKVGYVGNYYSALAPKKEFWQTWHDNIGVLSYDDNNRYYINEYFKQVLLNLDVEKVYSELDNSILLCYENNADFCHRHIVSSWFEILLDKKVKEIKIDDNKIIELYRPDYIKYYLKLAINENKRLRKINKL